MLLVAILHTGRRIAAKSKGCNEMRFQGGLEGTGRSIVGRIRTKVIRYKMNTTNTPHLWGAVGADSCVGDELRHSRVVGLGNLGAAGVLHRRQRAAGDSE